MIKEQDITILNTVNDYCDKDYGDAIIIYSIPGKNFESRCFVDNNGITYRKQIANFINECGGIDKFPLATDLSEELRMLITESDFDMLFIENDDENYPAKNVNGKVRNMN